MICFLAIQALSRSDTPCFLGSVLIRLDRDEKARFNDDDVHFGDCHCDRSHRNRLLSRWHIIVAVKEPLLCDADNRFFWLVPRSGRKMENDDDGQRRFYVPNPGGAEGSGNIVLHSTHFSFVMYFIMRRFTNSPAGRVLQAIRENEQRTESLGYNILHYKVMASVLSGVVASLSGVMYALSLRFVNTSVFAVDMTLDALLMTIIGGVGTFVGGLIGAGLIEFAHLGLTDLAKVHWIFERWLIFFGLVYILVVMFFPQGIVGTLKNWVGKRNVRRLAKNSSSVDSSH